jgi:hypothetical protein
MSDLRCARCELPRDTQDNFCRRCGHQFTVNLPAVRDVGLPQVRRARSAIPPSLVGSVAVLTLGTTAEWLARRLAGSATRAVARKVLGGETPSQLPAKTQQTLPRDVTVDEVLYVRKVQLKR